MSGMIDSAAKINTEYDSLFDAAKAKFEATAKEFLSKGMLKSYDLQDENKDKGLTVIFRRKPDDKELILTIYPKGEVFSAKFDGVFQNILYAYDLPEKLSTLDDLIKIARHYIVDRDYREEIYTQGNKTIYRRLIFAKGGSKGSSQAPLGFIRHFLGNKKTVVKPPLIK